ncbi:unnamed protein product [Symbiodinium necroappetens]|uniref:Copia protein n=1 Tax=Symbiodinium necroappetens TaxID=1628268 RepID=A0A812RMJ2_9DINO|nr:unnamed protein product [Symbiodinium necroappetens]
MSLWPAGGTDTLYIGGGKQAYVTDPFMPMSHCLHPLKNSGESAQAAEADRPASDAPGADLQAQLPGGGDLGEAEEAEADRHQQQSAPSSSSAHPPGRPELEVTDPVSAEELADILRSPPGIHLPQAPAEDDEMLPSPARDLAEPSRSFEQAANELYLWNFESFTCDCGMPAMIQATTMAKLTRASRFFMPLNTCFRMYGDWTSAAVRASPVAPKAFLQCQDYPRVMVIQAIHTAEHEVTLAEAAENAAEETHESLSEDFVPDAGCERESAPSVHTPHGPLSVIAEEPEDVAYAALLETAPDLSEAAREALRIFFQLDKVETLEQSSEPSYDTRNTLYMPPVELEPVEDVYIQHHQLGINPSQYARLNEHDESGNGFTELWFTREFSKVIGDDSLLKPAETYVLRMYASGFRNAVIQRESDLLTEQELRRHDEAVKAAILEELKIWEGYQCFERTPRKGAHNVMDSKFVAKWKVLKDASGADKRIIRMRLALRGFKDLQAHELESHAATASRQSQRCLCSEAALHPTWKFIALDINKAFLQGLTYREIHELTGEDERDVCFTLPPGSGALLRQLPGYEDFDERTEVLRCIKPGTGCKDAPRAFALKLAKYTRHPKIGLTPTLYDSELEVKLKDGRIVLMLAKHVDDLKVAGEPPEVDALVAHLESGFGKLTFSENCFTSCGLRHTRLPDGSIEMDQDEYISAMKAIRHPELTGRNSNEPCSEAVKGLYQSLLGAVAYALMSQAWASVFVIALQRRTSNPLNLHVRRLNLLLAALQKQKCKLRFPNMKCSRHLVAYSDASFDKESDSKGYGMRGTAVLRLGVRDGKSVCHLLEAQSQSLRLVTRSTFSSETLAAVGTVDNLVPWLYTLHEVQTGPLTSDEARSLREHGGFSMESELVVDAMNLYHALTAISPKPPAEKTLYSHLAWLRDLMCRHIPNVVTWCDTRDMIADALTKGKVSRDALLEAMKGMYSQVHEAKRYRKPVPTASSSSSKEERSEQGTA